MPSVNPGTERLEQAHESCYFAPGDALFREGDVGDCAYFIESGRIEIMTVVNNQPLSLAVLGNGDLVGEMALLDHQARNATAYVRKPTQAIRISPAHLLGKIDAADPLIALILKALLYRFREMRERLQRVVNQDPNCGVNSSTPAEQVQLSYAAESALAGQDMRDDLRLRRAFQNGELEMFAQPIFALARQRMVGAELLLRWRDPEKGLISPAQFVAQAERSGLIVDIGYWIIEQGCAALKRLDAQFAVCPEDSPLQYVSLNVSPRQLEDAAFVSQVAQILKEQAVPAGRVCLEITESVMLAHPRFVAAKLNQIKALGMRIALDDFGTGYSSLTSLLEFPIDTLKIDRSFVIRMLQETKARNIVKSILALSKDLGFSVIAEGVEYTDEAALLQQLGCPSIQGYLYGRPMPLKDVGGAAHS